jgi:hypothetical protein
VFAKEKEVPSLNTRTHLAIIGTTADWCPVSLWMMLHKDLEHHVERLQMSGQVDAKFQHHRVPAFLLKKNKMQMPKMNSHTSKQDLSSFTTMRGSNSVKCSNLLMKVGTGSH